MSTFIRVLLSILTLITFAATVYFTVLGVIINQPILVVSCAALAVGFGIFVYADIKYWYAKLTAKPSVPPTT